MKVILYFVGNSVENSAGNDSLSAQLKTSILGRARDWMTMLENPLENVEVIFLAK